MDSGFIRVKNPNEGVIQRSGLTDVIGTVWEVAPWSWAIDYFINVGEMLSNINGLFNNVEWKNRSWTWRNRGHEKLTGHLYPSGYGTQTQTFMHIWRNPQNAPVAYQPHFAFKISLQQTSYLMSAIALTLKGKMS